MLSVGALGHLAAVLPVHDLTRQFEDDSPRRPGTSRRSHGRGARRLGGRPARPNIRGGRFRGGLMTRVDRRRGGSGSNWCRLSNTVLPHRHQRCSHHQDGSESLGAHFCGIRHLDDPLYLWAEGWLALQACVRLQADEAIRRVYRDQCTGSVHSRGIDFRWCSLGVAAVRERQEAVAVGRTAH
jgi:hypothetical protein